MGRKKLKLSHPSWSMCHWDYLIHFQNYSWCVLKRVIYKPGECEMQCGDENVQAKNNLSSNFRIFKRTHFIVWRNWDNMEQNWDNMVVWRNWDNRFCWGIFFNSLPAPYHPLPLMVRGWGFFNSLSAPLPLMGFFYPLPLMVRGWGFF